MELKKIDKEKQREERWKKIRRSSVAKDLI